MANGTDTSRPSNAVCRQKTPMDKSQEVPWLFASIVAILLLRLWAMITYPLTDNTEARYGELARVTAEGGYWLMPHMTPDEPFFAKPPLSTWLSASSWKFLGVCPETCDQTAMDWVEKIFSLACGLLWSR